MLTCLREVSIPGRVDHTEGTFVLQGRRYASATVAGATTLICDLVDEHLAPVIAGAHVTAVHDVTTDQYLPTFEVTIAFGLGLAAAAADLRAHADDVATVGRLFSDAITIPAVIHV